MYLYGNPASMVGITLELRPMGPVPVIIATGICAIVGTSLRGPVEATGLRTSSLVYDLYKGGDLYEAGTLAFAQGCPNVYLSRVLGVGYAKAIKTLSDAATTPNAVLDVEARSDGNWGNSVMVRVVDGDAKQHDVEAFYGDDSVGPYALLMNDIVEDASNFVKVGGTALTVVYAEGDLGTGKVWVDKANGTIEFYDGEAPLKTQLISVNLLYKTRKLIIDDGEIQETFNNCKSLIDIQAKLDTSILVRGTPKSGQTHLPKAYAGELLEDGDDGDAPVLNDWLEAMNRIGEIVTPTTMAICDYEVADSSYDLVPVLEGWCNHMANLFKPVIGFTPTKPMESKENLLNLAAGYNNRLLCIEGNSWDCSSPMRNIAVARAAMEAAQPLGESAAVASSSMGGLDGLLKIWKETEVDELTEGGVDVCIMKGMVGAPRGIRPYIGISTATDWQFMRCVDNRTINWVIMAVKYITDQYYHRRRTRRVLSSLKASIVCLLNEQIEMENIEGYSVTVRAHATDTGRVDIDLQLQNIGHIERFRVLMSVGIMEGYAGFSV